MVVRDTHRRVYRIRSEMSRERGLTLSQLLRVTANERPLTSTRGGDASRRLTSEGKELRGSGLA